MDRKGALYSDSYNEDKYRVGRRLVYHVPRIAGWLLLAVSVAGIWACFSWTTPLRHAPPPLSQRMPDIIFDWCVVFGPIALLGAWLARSKFKPEFKSTGKDSGWVNPIIRVLFLGKTIAANRFDHVDPYAWAPLESQKPSVEEDNTGNRVDKLDDATVMKLDAIASKTVLIAEAVLSAVLLGLGFATGYVPLIAAGGVFLMVFVLTLRGGDQDSHDPLLSAFGRVAMKRSAVEDYKHAQNSVPKHPQQIEGNAARPSMLPPKPHSLPESADEKGT